MNKKLSAVTDEIKIRKPDKKSLLIMVLAAVGIILTVMSGINEASVVKQDESAAQLTAFSEADYTERLESKLEEMISSLSGAGRTKVTVTLECDYETVYARDGSYSQKDGASDEENEYIIIDTDKNEGGLVLKTVTPRVRGVAVLCEGGETAHVVNAVCEMLEALLNISPAHISVAKIQ